MKHLLTIILVFPIIMANATVRRVNNNSGVIPVAGLVYITFASAQTDASPGDTIYIEPSASNYQFLDGISKRLTIIGNGYSVGSNAGLISPLPQNSFESKVAGSETNVGAILKIKSGAENSVLIGLSFQTLIIVECGNVLFERCTMIIGASVNLNSSNNIFKNCFTKDFGPAFGAIQGSGQNNLIENSILGDGISNLTGLVVNHCFIDDINSITNGTFTNCIINGTVNGSNNTFANCIKIGNSFPTPGINNNIENVNMSDIFVVANPLTGNGQLDKDYRLKAGSPAIGSGINGTDMGPFGGSSPYRLSGQPPIPIITNFFLSTTGSTSSGLTGSITIQSNN